MGQGGWIGLHGPWSSAAAHLLGNVFKVDGTAESARRSAPALDQHRAELLGQASGSA